MSALGLELDQNRHKREDETRRACLQRRFLACYEMSGRIGEAARWAKISRSTHWLWMETDPTYAPRFRVARQRAAQMLEDEAVRRAREGVAKIVLYKGKPVYVNGKPLMEHQYSDQLLIQLLKANDPERFRDRMDINNLLEIDVDKLTPAQQDMIVDNVLKRHMSADEAAEYRKQLEAAVQIEGTLIEEDQDASHPAPVWTAMRVKGQCAY